MIGSQIYLQGKTNQSILFKESNVFLYIFLYNSPFTFHLSPFTFHFYLSPFTCPWEWKDDLSITVQAHVHFWSFKALWVPPRPYDCSGVPERAAAPIGLCRKCEIGKLKMYPSPTFTAWLTREKRESCVCYWQLCDEGGSASQMAPYPLFSALLFDQGP